MKKIDVQISEDSFDAWLDESLSPDTVQKIMEALPIETKINTWGEEFYFRIPVEAGSENGVEKVSVGDLAFWPQGQAFCIFFGKTPMSRSEEEIIPASAVNPIGKIEGIDRLKTHKAGETIRIRKA